MKDEHQDRDTRSNTLVGKDNNEYCSPVWWLGDPRDNTDNKIEI